MNLVSPDLHGLLNDAKPVVAHDEAHKWRSKIVDKSAEVERQVLRLLHACCGKWQRKAPLSQKIEALKRSIAEAASPISVTKVAPLLERLQPLSELRSELVHSTLSITDMDGQSIVILWNASDDQETDLRRVVLTFDRLRRCHWELSDIANSLRQEADRVEEKAGPPLSRG
jgi:hypothetical protein